MDRRLHASRLAATGKAPPPAGPVEILPDGAVVASGERAFAVRAGRLLPWSFSGYGPPLEPTGAPGPLRLLTPVLTLRTLGAGFRPVWHPTVSCRTPGRRWADGCRDGCGDL